MSVALTLPVRSRSSSRSSAEDFSAHRSACLKVLSIVFMMLQWLWKRGTAADRKGGSNGQKMIAGGVGGGAYAVAYKTKNPAQRAKDFFRPCIFILNIFLLVFLRELVK